MIAVDRVRLLAAARRRRRWAAFPVLFAMLVFLHAGLQHSDGVDALTAAAISFAVGVVGVVFALWRKPPETDPRLPLRLGLPWQQRLDVVRVLHAPGTVTAHPLVMAVAAAEAERYRGSTETAVLTLFLAVLLGASAAQPGELPAAQVFDWTLAVLVAAAGLWLVWCRRRVVRR